MKLHPGDIIFDKNFNRTLTIIEVKKAAFSVIGETQIEYELVSFMSSNEPQSQVLLAYDYEFDSWAGIEVLKVNT